MTVNSQQLIDELVQTTRRTTAAVQRLKREDISKLNYKSAPSAWSALECIEHLNLYGNYYLPEIEQSMLAQAASAPSPVFKAGVIGNYFAKLMQVRADGSVKKMQSPKDKNPLNSVLTVTTLDRFLKQQERLLALLEQARGVNLTRAKTPISLTKLIKLRLGDTFRFFVYHIERHVLQAERAVAGSDSIDSLVAREKAVMIR